MLAIRFNRTGKRNQAHFRVVLQEHTKAPGKRHIEILGSYDPHKKTTILKKERILYWISQGAQVSPVVSNLLVREGVIDAKKIAKRMPRPVAKEEPAVEVVAEEVKTEEVQAAEAPVSEETASASVAPEVAETPSETEPALVEEVKAEETVVTPEVKAEEVPAVVAEAGAVEAEAKA